MVEKQIALPLASTADGRRAVHVPVTPGKRRRPNAGAVKGGSVLSTAPLLVASVVEALVALARNICLAHLIAPREFGLAISLSVTAGLIEVLADLGIPVYIVRKSIDPSQHSVMATAQSLAILRAAFVAMALFAAAPFIAHILGDPQATSAFFFLGVIAIVRSFENLGIKALTRNFQFGREAAIVIASHLTGFVLTTGMAVLLRSFTCVLWGMAAQAFIVAFLSNILSPDPYRLGWNKKIAWDMTAFGLPLLVNGMAVAVCLSDRLLIGSILNPSSLALYNVMVGTAQFPRVIAVKFLTSTLVPAFANRRHAPEQHRQLFQNWAWMLSALAFLYGFFLCVCGREILTFVFGPTYAPSHAVMSLTALFIAGSFLMHMPVPPAYASGDTKVVSYGSVINAIVLLPALTILLITRSLTGFMSAFAFAQYIGLIVLLQISRRRQVFSCSSVWAAVCLPFGLLALLAAAAFDLSSNAEAEWLTTCGIILALAVVIYLPVLSRLRFSASTTLKDHAMAHSTAGVDRR